MPTIRSGMQFPAGVHMRADRRYTCEDPIITPYRQQEIEAAPTASRRAMQNINECIDEYI